MYSKERSQTQKSADTGFKTSRFEETSFRVESEGGSDILDQLNERDKMAIKTLRHLRQSGALLPNFKNHASLNLFNNLQWQIKQTTL